MSAPELKTGIKAKLSETVVPENTADSIGSGTLPVYATPCMIALIERTAVLCLAPYIGEGQASVGTLVNIQHLSATPIGCAVTCEAELTEIDRRRLTFTVEVTDSSGAVIGKGTHERFIVDSEKFMEKASGKNGQGEKA